MKNQTMEYNSPGASGNNSIGLCCLACLLKISTAFLDVAPALATTATVVTILAGVTTILYNATRYYRERNK